MHPPAGGEEGKYAAAYSGQGRQSRNRCNTKWGAGRTLRIFGGTAPRRLAAVIATPPRLQHHGGCQAPQDQFEKSYREFPGVGLRPGGQWRR